MGQEQSTYEGPTEVLEARDLPSVAKYIKSGKCKKIYVMLGAGVSTSAGIPDFRSPDTGLYANLARLNLPYPEAVFEINYFRENPTPFYALARELLPGQFRPTLTHSFIKLLADKGLLGMCFTQNIDTLERLAGVPPDRIVEAHGSFATQHCIDCKAPYDGTKLREQIKKGEVARCEQCGGLVKPDIVFFGEALPPQFHSSIPMLRSADLLIVMGTSLKVQPFASLITMVPRFCPRVLINMERVGDFGARPEDVVCLGKTDEVVRELAKLLGWEEELDKAWKETEGVAATFDADVSQGTLKKEVDNITDEVGKSLNISQVQVPGKTDASSEGAKVVPAHPSTVAGTAGSGDSLRVEVSGIARPTYVISGYEGSPAHDEETGNKAEGSTTRAFTDEANEAKAEEDKGEREVSQSTKVAEEKL
ncbi:NAD-dependent deacetylase sirtuin-2 [Panus rudis PR-1116 ss-1]|nr:NAD-dependent deacetylase sirtuin-2 [Panus rudis PR-1116 ss-1]